ncbi:hypothetical protein CYY_003375 [Polysphondylium violaceum]|uniref:Leucine-rich repeat-containing protein n=1 Tax=Polysphondylium violaceum TaxID=133409 RepID=A0A8J4V199_9MYCE|nr:hypothetical protein CYY_003375 [Polysphondylium violaceum]
MADEITQNDRKNISHILTQKNQESVLMSIAEKISKKKTKKPSKRIILVTKNRVLFFKPGVSKIKKETHLLDINEIRSTTSSEVIFITKSFSYGLITNKADEIINQIQTIFGQTFLGYPQDYYKFDVKPPSRVKDNVPKDLPCGGFVETYTSLCDYYSIPIRDDICWDMANIVSSKNIKTFNIGEIEQPISPGDIKALLSALKYNTYFKSLVFNGHPFGKDQFIILAELLKTNSTIEDLSLNNTGLKSDTLPIISTTLAANKNLALTSIDLSNNPFEDKGMVPFSAYVAASPRGIASLDVSNTGTGKVGIAALTNALKKNIKMTSTLQYLNLSNNKMEADGSAGLANFLANPNALRTLNISNTFPILDTIVGALVRGCLELRSLDLSDIRLTKKETAHLVRFIGASSTLKFLNLNNTKVPVENLKEIVVAIYSNIYLQDVNLDLKNNDLSIAGARMLSSVADKLNNVTILDLSENDFGDEGVSVICEGFTSNTCVKRLLLNGNFKTSKTKSRSASIESVITLLESECPIETLHITAGNSKSPLKNDILPLIYSLATNSSLLELDITGHQMGVKGAIALGKALQTNKTLHTLIWDENLTTLAGFSGFLVGLERNLTLKNMQTPLTDIIAAHRENPTKLQSVLKDIDNCINRNQSPSRAFEGTGGVGATNLSFLASGQQQSIEKLLNKIKSIGRKATDPDQLLVIGDAENTEKVIGGLHLIREAVHSQLEMELNAKLKDFVKVANDIIDAKKNEMTQQILESMSSTFKSMDPQTYKRLATGIQFGSKDVDEIQIHSTLVKGAGAELSSRANECFISALDIASDYTYEKISLGLEIVFKDLLEESLAENSNDSSPAPSKFVPSEKPTEKPPKESFLSPTKEQQPPVAATSPVSAPPTSAPPLAPRTGAAAPPQSPEVIPQPVFKPSGLKLAGANSAVAAAIARNIGGGAPPIRKPAAPMSEGSVPPSSTTPTPAPSGFKPKPVAPPRSAGTAPSSAAAPSKPIVAKKPSPPSANASGDISTAPDSNTEELVHVTKDRPQVAHKRKPPTRRPRPPTEH